MRFLLVVPALWAGANAKDSWAGACSFGPSKSVIIRSETTIQPGRAPNQPKGAFLTIWPGISNGTGNLIQTTLENHEAGRPRCGEKPGEWCIMASVFGRPWGQLDAKMQSVVKPTQKVKIEYILERDNETWRQHVTDATTGTLLSTLSTKSGPYMRGWGTAVECQRDCHGTTEPHYYTDTTIVFRDPEPGFRMSPREGAICAPPTSSDGGRVWRISKMTIPPSSKSGGGGGKGPRLLI